MGIDYDGGMVVGAKLEYEILEKLKEKFGDDLLSYFYEINMNKMSPWFDADEELCYWGYPVDNIGVAKIDEKWLKEIRDKAKKFEELTGVTAVLVGCQNIT